MIFTVHAHNDEMNGVQEHTSLSNMLQMCPPDMAAAPMLCISDST